MTQRGRNSSTGNMYSVLYYTHTNCISSSHIRSVKKEKKAPVICLGVRKGWLWPINVGNHKPPTTHMNVSARGRTTGTTLIFTSFTAFCTFLLGCFVNICFSYSKIIVHWKCMKLHVILVFRFYSVSHQAGVLACSSVLFTAPPPTPQPPSSHLSNYSIKRKKKTPSNLHYKLM